MALQPRLPAATANAAMDAAIGNVANSGKLRIYDGTQPATGDTAISTQNLLAELTLNADAFPAASGGVLTANAITQDSAADATGTATWFRLLQSDGSTKIIDGSVGTSSADLVLGSTAIQVGAAVQVTSLTFTLPLS
jgi:hypothetical protein